MRSAIVGAYEEGAPRIRPSEEGGESCFGLSVLFSRSAAVRVMVATRAAVEASVRLLVMVATRAKMEQARDAFEQLSTSVGDGWDRGAVPIERVVRFFCVVDGDGKLGEVAVG